MYRHRAVLRGCQTDTNVDTCPGTGLYYENVRLTLMLTLVQAQGYTTRMSDLH